MTERRQAFEGGRPELSAEEIGALIEQNLGGRSLRELVLGVIGEAKPLSSFYLRMKTISDYLSDGSFEAERSMLRTFPLLGSFGQKAERLRDSLGMVRGAQSARQIDFSYFDDLPDRMEGYRLLLADPTGRLLADFIAERDSYTPFDEEISSDERLERRKDAEYYKYLYRTFIGAGARPDIEIEVGGAQN